MTVVTCNTQLLNRIKRTGYGVNGLNSVEEVVVLTGNKPGGGKTSRRGEWRALLQELLSYLGISGICYPIQEGSWSTVGAVQAVLPLPHNIIMKLADIRPACSLVYNQSEQTKLFGRVE